MTAQHCFVVLVLAAHCGLGIACSYSKVELLDHRHESECDVDLWGSHLANEPGLDPEEHWPEVPIRNAACVPKWSHTGLRVHIVDRSVTALANPAQKQPAYNEVVVTALRSDLTKCRALNRTLIPVLTQCRHVRGGYLGVHASEPVAGPGDCLRSPTFLHLTVSSTAADLHAVLRIREGRSSGE